MATTIISTIFVFGLLVFVHEFGHFITAKLVGMRVDEFAIGFGPSLYKRRYKETLYSLRIIPLGGYNKIAGMDPDEEQDAASFNSKPVWARMLVIVAGSTMNFILPVILFMVVFLSAGIEKPVNDPIIGTVMEGKPAAYAGLKSGDLILEVNSQKISTWLEFVNVIRQNSGSMLEIKYLRDNTFQTVNVTPEFDSTSNRGVIGVIPKIITYHPDFIESITLSVKQTFGITAAMLVGLYQMISGQIAAEVSGPIGVAQMAGQVAQRGIVPLLQFAAFLSINLGLINLLPVPALDGGHVVTLLVEAVRGKPLSREKMQFIQTLGFSLLILLMLVATFKDIARLKLF